MLYMLYKMYKLVEGYDKDNNRMISGQVAHSTFTRKKHFHMILSTNNSSGRNKTAVI